MAKIILDEKGNWTGCPSEPICMRDCNPTCIQYPVQLKSSTVGSMKEVEALNLDMTAEEVLRLWKEGKLWRSTNDVRRCAVCGKVVKSGYVWDNTDTFCSKGCVAKALADDPGCVEILLDAGRIEWQENFSKAKGL